MVRKHPALIFLGFVVAGIVCADLTHIPSWLFLLAAFLTILASGPVALRSMRAAAVLVGFALTCLAAFHFAKEHYDLTPRHIARVADESQTVQIFGQVSDWPDLRTNFTELKVEVDSLGGRIGRKVEGTILLKVTDTTTAVQRGDRLEFWARIYPMVGGENGGERFDYRRYLQLKGVFGIVYLPTLLDVRIDKRSPLGLFSIVDRLRDAIRNTFNEYLSPDGAALASGFLIGETRNIPVHVYQWFRDSGTLHLLAVSGSNVALVLVVIAYLLRPFGLSRNKREVALLVVIVLFTMLPYGQPSVIRASVMAALVIAAQVLRRRVDLNHIIALTMLIVLLWDPAQLYDIGFQLSFATAWGLIFFVPKITPLFEGHHNSPWYRYLAFPIIISLVAQICSTPLIVYYFGRVPVWSLAANLVIVPLVSVAVIGVMVLLTAAVVLPFFGAIAGTGVDAIMRLTMAGVNLFGGGAGSVLEFDSARAGAWSWLLIAAVYASLVMIGLAVSGRRYRFPALLATLITLNTALMVPLFSSLRPKAETMTFARIPGGVAAIHHRADWRSADLVLTGIAGKEYAVDERVIRPILAARHVEALRYVFVLKSTYPAIDDLLRVGDYFRADSVFVTSQHRKAVLDVSRDSSFNNDLRQKLSFFPGGLGDDGRNGYFPSDRALLFRHGSQTILISSQSEIAALSSHLTSGIVIVLGGDWRPTADDLQALRRVSPRAVICARIAQRSLGQRSSQRDLPLTDLPCPIYDLSVRNEFVLSLDQATSED